MEISNNPNLTSSRLKIVLFTIFFNIAAVMVFAHLPWSDWRTGMALNLFNNAIFIIYAWHRRDRLMDRLLLFGIVLGFTELIADAWLVDFTRTLDYSIGGGPMIWRSPLWMPFAWEIVAVQFAVLGGWLTYRFKSYGILLAGLIGAINIPFYEEMARQTKWWAYHHCRMLLHTPYYIIFGEFWIVIAITIFSRRVLSGRLNETVWAGLSSGFMIFICYAVAFWIFES